MCYFCFQAVLARLEAGEVLDFSAVTADLARGMPADETNANEKRATFGSADVSIELGEGNLLEQSEIPEEVTVTWYLGGGTPRNRRGIHGENHLSGVQDTPRISHSGEMT